MSDIDATQTAGTAAGANRGTLVDVAIVGGGAAGLAAAVVLARSLRSVIVLDGGEPRNAPAAGVHNLLGQEGIATADLLIAGRAEAQGYGAVVRRAEVREARRTDEGFELRLDDGRVRARRLLLAGGLHDELPDLPGLAERWGRTVLHCPFCHGYEVRGQRIGVLATSPMSLHQVLLFSRLSEDVTVLLHDGYEPDAEQREQLDALGVRVVAGPVRAVVGEPDAGPDIELASGLHVPLDALVVAPRFVARAETYEQLGGTLTEHPAGRYISAGPMGQTDLPGVFAAGNVADVVATVAASAAAGGATGGFVHSDLAAEELAAAVTARRGAGAPAGV